MSAASAETFARQVQNERGAEKKLDKLARSMWELASTIADMERRIQHIETMAMRAS
jgi:hypothetical protein